MVIYRYMNNFRIRLVFCAGVWLKESFESSESFSVSNSLFTDHLPWRLLSGSILAPSGVPFSAPELCLLSILPWLELDEKLLTYPLKLSADMVA
jgi:hypothetical protein